MGLLADGQAHSRESLRGCVPGFLSDSLRQHICYLRRKLRPNGETILCVLVNRKIHYQYVRLITPSVKTVDSVPARVS